MKHDVRPNVHIRRTDRIALAESIIDEVIADWPGSRGIGSLFAVNTVIRGLFTAKGELQWYNESFSDRGWEVLIGHRLTEAGYKKYGWGYGR